MIYELKNKSFWIDEVVENLFAYMKEQGMDTEGLITCAAGMTPSCPIHFGILREIAISSFVADELRSRGCRVRLVYYWDDYDHFCKIPFYTTKDAVEPYIGKTLREVPDFSGNFNSYGEHYMHTFELCLHRVGITPEYDYQAMKYRSGYYKKYIQNAIEKRFEIFDIINSAKQPYTDEVKKQREAYYPLEVYCENADVTVQKQSRMIRKKRQSPMSAKNAAMKEATTLCPASRASLYGRQTGHCAGQMIQLILKAREKTS